MREHKIPIPSRIYNAAVGGHVTGADQIIDDKTGLTLDKVAGGALEEKEYTLNSNNGMGRVVLRKNLVEGVNTLTQAMINKSNTIYVIQYDFTLSEDITIPTNCILEFNGGSISASNNDYTITGQNTCIKAELVKIFNINIIISGTWNVAEVYPEWFGAIGDGINDDTNPIQKTIDSFHHIVLNATYNISNTINIGKYIFNIVIGAKAMIKVTKNIDYLFKYIITEDETISAYVVGIENKITGLGGIIDCNDKSCFLYYDNAPKNVLTLDGLRVRNIGTGSLNTLYGFYLNGGCTMCSNCNFAVRTDGSDTGPEYMLYLKRDDNRLIDVTIVTANIGIWLQGTNILQSIHIYGAVDNKPDKAYIVVGDGGTNGLMFNNIYFDTPWTCIEAEGSVGPVMMTNLYVLGIYWKNNTTHALLKRKNSSIIDSWHGEISYTILKKENTENLNFYEVTNNNFEDVSNVRRVLNIHSASNTERVKYDESFNQWFLGYKNEFVLLNDIKTPTVLRASSNNTLDLNNYFSPGFYRSPDATYISNRPASMTANNGFTMSVRYTSDATILQTLITTPSLDVYYRYKSANDIGRWFRAYIQDDFMNYGYNPNATSPKPSKMGSLYFDTFRNHLCAFNTDTGIWYRFDGESYAISDSGATESRPTPKKVGFCFFDTTLGKPIWWNGTTWVDTTGITV